jgi:hypothetical protein
MDKFTLILAISLAVFLFSTGVIVGADFVISDCAHYGEFKTSDFEMTCKVVK